MQVVERETRQWMVGGWLSDAALAPLAELNAQCLELVCEGARRTGQGVQAGIAQQIARLTPQARAGLARAPYLLADAGFDEPVRWQGVAQWRVQDAGGPAAEAAFEGEGGALFIRSVLTYGWHLARAHQQIARVVLGMTPACARSIGALSLGDLNWACQNRPDWVRLRWDGRPQLWSQLLAAARDGDRAALQRATLRGIQLMGALALERRGG